MGIFSQMADRLGYSPELRDCIIETINDLLKQETSYGKPGILLGKVQSGKTRAYLGIIGLSFDKGYDVAVILTKGTKSLARQTLKRVREDFGAFIQGDQVQVYDIMSLPENLTRYELGQKLILVVKKEDDNIRRLLNAFKNKYPSLTEKHLLIVDDEADTASVSFRRNQGQINIGVISQQIDQLRTLVKNSSYLQVTATPYSLYLQPKDDTSRGGTSLFKPKKPAFTKILPIFPEYVGGDYYFEMSSDPTSPTYYFYEQVPLAERDTLKQEDRRSFKIENVLEHKNSVVLVRAIINFIMGGTIRRIQQKASSQPEQKYSFLFHTESSRQSHEWQKLVTCQINDELVAAAQKDSPILENLVLKSYEDLGPSIMLAGTYLPSYNEVLQEMKSALLAGHLVISKVNSDSDIEALLDEDGQFRLRTPLNLFIGGQILDRGITIMNLIGFYYGRNPRKFQQDTVLQHSRMYGLRPQGDLPVTRFYAPPHIYQIMRNIHEFDSALREAFLLGAHDRGVYFIQRDAADRLVPCSPNKLLFSKIKTIRPGRRVVPVDFQTISKTDGKKRIEGLDQRITIIVNGKIGEPVQIDIREAIKLLELSYELIKFDDADDEQMKAQIAMLEHFSLKAEPNKGRGTVWLITAVDRDVARYREAGRFSDAPDTKQQAEEAQDKAIEIPVLELLRQNGKEEKGWRELPFWWPVLVTPRNSITSVFAAEAPQSDS